MSYYIWAALNIFTSSLGKSKKGCAMKSLRHIAFYCAVSTIFLNGCFTTETPSTSNKDGVEPVIQPSSKGDPFTPANMQKALVELVKSRSNNLRGLAKSAALSELDSISIEPNYKYVRFLPEGARQIDFLRGWDSNVVLFDHPLSYSAEDSLAQALNRDPFWSDSTVPYYASVPIEYSLPNEIRYEVIKPLFLIQPILTQIESDSLLQEGDTSAALAKVASETNLTRLIKFLASLDISFPELEFASLELTGNKTASIEDSLPGPLAKKSLFGWDRWRPSGTLKYRDSRLGDVPVVGVRVTAGYSYYWRSSKTNASGYFSSPERWTYSVKYEAHWDADDFLLEDGDSWNGADLMTEGPTSYSAWNRTFVDQHSTYAVIFTAAYNYYYNSIDGLNRPRENTWTNFALDIQVYNKDGNVYGSHGVWPWLANWMEIYLKDGSAYRASDELFGTTTHELGHSAHYAHFWTRHPMVPRDYEWNYYVGGDIQETFARGVQWWLTRKRYTGYQVPSYSGNYKGNIQDLIDADGVYAKTSDGGDNVRGFTIAEIEQAAKKSFNLDELRDRLKWDYPSNGTRVYSNADMDNLFAYWKAVK